MQISDSRFQDGGVPSQSARLSGAAENPCERLTPRELQVLRLLGDGFSTKAIAGALGIAFKTAACHRSRILGKLGVTETVSAVRWAIRVGFIEP